MAFIQLLAIAATLQGTPDFRWSGVIPAGRPLKSAASTAISAPAHAQATRWR